MTNNDLPLSKIITELVQKNSESLAEDLKQYMDNNDKLSEYEVTEIYPQLYDTLFKELISQFDNFNKNHIYTKEIESIKFSNTERRNYYTSLYWDTLHKLIIYKKSDTE